MTKKPIVAIFSFFFFLTGCYPQTGVLTDEHTAEVETGADDTYSTPHEGAEITFSGGSYDVFTLTDGWVDGGLSNPDEGTLTYWDYDCLLVGATSTGSWDLEFEVTEGYLYETQLSFEGFCEETGHSKCYVIASPFADNAELDLCLNGASWW